MTACLRCFFLFKKKKCKKIKFPHNKFVSFTISAYICAQSSGNMKKLLLSVFLFMAVSAIQAFAAPDYHFLNNFNFVDMVQETQISMSGNVLRVIDAAGQNVEVFNVTGVRVFCKRVESNDQSFQLGLTRGCYIVKVGRVVRKVNIV